MFIAAAAIAIAAVFWSIALLRYNDLPLACVVFLIVTSVFSADFFGIDAGGLTWTLDRFWLAFIGAQIAVNTLQGQMRWRRLQSVDFLLLAFVVWLAARTLVFPLGSVTPEQPPTLMHLLNGYLIPIFIYASLRVSRITPRSIVPAVAALILFGVYLSVTAIFEAAGIWSLVFPKFIADPTLGIHFGRARGPMLQSVRLGVCLNACLLAVWVFVLNLRRTEKWAWMLAAGLTPLLLFAIFLTKTRSIWMGTIAIILLAMWMMLRGRVRFVALSSVVVGGAAAALIVGPSLLAFKREYSAAETLESTRMRAAFAYVSYKMVLDKPLVGFGFNQFQIANLPYLDDRTTTIRVESIRGYVHHNSFLSLLVDLGLIGGLLYGAVTAGFVRCGWRLYTNSAAPPWARATAIFAAGVAASHAIQMAFHEVSFSTIENSLLAVSLGWMTACQQDFASRGSIGRGWLLWRTANRSQREWYQPAAQGGFATGGYAIGAAVQGRSD